MTGQRVVDDPVLVHLGEVLDPVAVLPLLRRLLPSGGGVEIEGCVVDRVRYRRGLRAVVQYTARVVDPSTEEHRDQWISALLYPPDRARQVWGKVAKMAAASGDLGDSPLLPVAFAPERAVILQTFPFDRRLPSLPVLTRPKRLAGRLPPVGTPPETWKAKPVRYRAGLGCALRWHLDAESNGARTRSGPDLETKGPAGTRWVKVYRDDQGAATHEVLLALRAQARRAGPGRTGETFDVPEPVAYLADHRALVQQEVLGRSLAELLLDSQDPAPTMRRVAAALARWHREPPATARRRTSSDVLDDVARAAALVSWVRPSLAETAEEVVARVADRLVETELASTHGDLKPDHVVVRDHGVALVDLDSFSGADPVMDAGSLLARLAGTALRHPAAAGQITAAASAFTDGYFDRVPARWLMRLPPHHAGALMEEAAGCFRHQFPHWPGLMDALVQRAAEAAAW